MRLNNIIKLSLLLAPLVFADSSYAVNMKGKFGMGPRWWGFPLFAFATTRFGVAQKVSLEPTLGFYSAEENSILIMGGLGNFSVSENSAGNVYARAGFLISKESSDYSSTDNIGLVAGYGLEHFVNEHFAINAGVLSCFWKESSSQFSYSSSNTGLLFGNQLFDFTLLWYY